MRLKPLLILLVLAPVSSWGAFPSVASWDTAIEDGSCITLRLTLGSSSSLGFVATSGLTSTGPSNQRVRHDSGSAGTVKQVATCFLEPSTPNYLFICEDQNGNQECDSGEWFLCSSTGTLIDNIQCTSGEPPTWNPGAISVDEPVAPSIPAVTPPAATVTYTPASCAELNTNWDTMNAANAGAVCRFEIGFVTGRAGCFRDSTGAGASNWYVDVADCTSLELVADIDPAYLATSGWTPLYWPQTIYLKPDPATTRWFSPATNDGAGVLVLEAGVALYKGANIGFGPPDVGEMPQHRWDISTLTQSGRWPMDVGVTTPSNGCTQYLNLDIEGVTGLNGRPQLCGDAFNPTEFQFLSGVVPQNTAGSFTSGFIWTINAYLLRDCASGSGNWICDLHDSNGLVADAGLTPNSTSASVTGGTITLAADQPSIGGDSGGNRNYALNKTIQVSGSVDCDGLYNINSVGGSGSRELGISASCTSSPSITVTSMFEYVVTATDGSEKSCYIEEVDGNTIRIVGAGCEAASMTETPDYLSGQFGPRLFSIIRYTAGSGAPVYLGPGPIMAERPWLPFYTIRLTNRTAGDVFGVWHGSAAKGTGGWIPKDALGGVASKLGSCCVSDATNSFGQARIPGLYLGDSTGMRIRNYHKVNVVGIGDGNSSSETNTDWAWESSSFWITPSIRARQSESVSYYLSQQWECKDCARMSFNGVYFSGTYQDITPNCGNIHMNENVNQISDISITNSIFNLGGCTAQFAVGTSANSGGAVVPVASRIKLHNNLVKLDYKQPVYGANPNGLASFTGSLAYPRMPFQQSLQQSRNTYLVSWNLRASAIQSVAAYCDYCTLTENILPDAALFALRSLSGTNEPCPGNSFQDATFWSCWTNTSTSNITNNRVVGFGALGSTSMNVSPGASRTSLLDSTSQNNNPCGSRWNSISGTTTCAAGSTPRQRSAAAFDGDGWEPIGAGEGADPAAVMAAAGFLEHGPYYRLVGSTLQLVYTAGFSEPCSVWFKEGTQDDYSVLMQDPPPSKFTDAGGVGERVLDLTGAVQSTNYIGYFSCQRGGWPRFLNRVRF